MTTREQQELNEEIRDWTKGTFTEEKNRYMKLINSPGRSGDGLDSLKTRFGMSYGGIDNIGFKMNRYLVFVHKGVGKGRGAGSGKERPKEWFNPVLDEKLPDLANRIEKHHADAAVNRIYIK